MALFRAVFYVGGAVATLAGLATVVLGADSLPGAPASNAVVESDLRFYSAFYVAYGAGLLWLAPRAEREPTLVRAAAGALFLAGLARAGAWITDGRPHDLQIALLGIELALPPILVLWQSRFSPPGRTRGRSR